MTTDTTTEPTAPAFSRLETLVGVAVVGVLALALALIGLTRPTEAIEEQSVDFGHSGTFDYTADSASRSVYGAEGIEAGEPILTDVVGPVTMQFDYELEGPPGEVAGTGEMVADVKLPQGLERQFEIATQESFDGRTVTLEGNLPTRQITRFVQRTQASFGDTGFLGATVTVRPVIKVTGDLAGRDLEAKFAPELPFTLDGSALTLSQAGAPTEVGATDPLEPTEAGQIEFEASVANTVPLLLVEPTVVTARVVGLGVAGVCLLLGLWLALPFLRSGARDGDHARIRSLYGSHIMEVRDLSPHLGPVARVASIDALADLAKKYESMIMHVTDEVGDAYLVWDNGMMFEYRPARPDRAEQAGIPQTSGLNGTSRPRSHTNS